MLLLAYCNVRAIIDDERVDVARMLGFCDSIDIERREAFAFEWLWYKVEKTINFYWLWKPHCNGGGTKYTYIRKSP